MWSPLHASGAMPGKTDTFVSDNSLHCLQSTNTFPSALEAASNRQAPLAAVEDVCQSYNGPHSSPGVTYSFLRKFHFRLNNLRLKFANLDDAERLCQLSHEAWWSTIHVLQPFWSGKACKGCQKSRETSPGTPARTARTALGPALGPKWCLEIWAVDLAILIASRVKVKRQAS